MPEPLPKYVATGLLHGVEEHIHSFEDMQFHLHPDPPVSSALDQLDSAQAIDGHGQ